MPQIAPVRAPLTAISASTASRSGWHGSTNMDRHHRRLIADSLSELLQPDSAAMLVGLAEHAIEKIENAMKQVDDSNGEIGGIG